MTSICSKKTFNSEIGYLHIKSPALKISAMRIYFPLLLLVVFSFAIGCSEKKEASKASISKEAISDRKLPAVLEDGITAHGGLAQWNKMKALSFSFKRGETMETQKIALDNRKCFIKREGAFELGFDGDQVWVTPNKTAFGKGSPRFYHNLLFYFYAIPYVLADPGIIYEEVTPRVIDGKTYPGIKIAYQDSVGDAPDDYYIAYFDPDTGLLYLLLYTVTYYEGAPNEKYNALIYPEWEKVNGLQLPKKMAGYKFAAGTIGDKRYERIFENIQLSEVAFPDGLFERPEGAEIDSLLVKK